MKARIIRSLFETGSAARDYIRLVCGRKHCSTRRVAENQIPVGASNILESFRNNLRQPAAEYILNGRNVIKALDEQMLDLTLPFEFSATARRLGRGIVEGSSVTIPGDDRVFRVVKVWYEYESVRIEDPEDPEGNQYVLPWNMVKLFRGEEES